MGAQHQRTAGDTHQPFPSATVKVPIIYAETSENMNAVGVGIYEAPPVKGVDERFLGQRVSIAILVGSAAFLALLEPEHVEWLRRELDAASARLAQAARLARIGGGRQDV